MKWNVEQKECKPSRFFALIPVKLDYGNWIWLEWYRYRNWHTWGSSGTYRWQTSEDTGSMSVDFPKFKKDV